MGSAQPREEVAHVLGSDIVSFSLKTIEAQIECVQKLHSVLLEVLAGLDPKPVVMDTGDGSILVFSGSLAPALRAAEFMAVRARDIGLQVRIGLHTGLVTQLEDSNGHANAYGPGVNLAQRVMSAAAAGGLLVSSTTSDLARSYEGWQSRFIDIGTVAVKHGERVAVFGVAGFEGLGSGTALVDADKLAPRRHNLRLSEHSVVGRESEKARLAALLLDDRRRLVTIAGPGGIGKTCLATMMGWFLVPDFADGVWFVDCDELRSGEEIEAKLASVLRMDAGDREAGRVQEHLDGKQCLIILDCLEKIPGVASVIESWLERAPEVQVVATSRVVLGSKWETEMFIGPLRTKRGEDGSVDAERLFVEAARKFDPTFVVSRANHGLIEAIVEAVQGVPLSLILAAGRLRYMSLPELRDKLAVSKINVLKRRGRAGDKHSDLSQVIAESFNLLDEPARLVLASLSVFSGGFFVDNAQAVLAGVPQVLDSLEVLRDSSLISPSMSGKRMRYRCLDAVSEYLETLPGETDILSMAHAEHFASVAQKARDVFDKGSWDAESELFWEDLGNYRRAISFSIRSRSAYLVQSLARSLARIFMEAGLRADFEQLAMEAEKVATEDLPLRLELQGLLGGIYRREDNRKMAETYWLKRAETLSEGDDFASQADAWIDLACMALHYADDGATKEYLDRYWQVVPRLKKGETTALGSISSGKWLLRQGQPDRARLEAAQAEDSLRASVLGSRALFGYTFLAELYSDLGDYERGVSLCAWAIPEAVKSKHTSYAGYLLLSLSVSLLGSGDLAGSVKALALAGRIPKSISRVLNVRFQQVKQKIDDAVASLPLEEQAMDNHVVNWAVEAVVFSNELVERVRDERIKSRESDATAT